MFKVHCLLVIILIAHVSGAPLDQDRDAKILENEYTIDEKGNYKFSFKTSNGMTREETGSIVDEGLPNQHFEVVGHYTYYDTEGKEQIVEYAAGENGYIILPPRPMIVAAPSPAVVASLLGK